MGPEKKKEYHVTGIHFLFWYFEEGMEDKPWDAYNPTYDIFWSSEEADKTEERYRRELKNIKTFRVDYSQGYKGIPNRNPEADKGIEILRLLTPEARLCILNFLILTISADRYFRNWIKKGRPEYPERRQVNDSIWYTDAFGRDVPEGTKR